MKIGFERDLNRDPQRDHRKEQRKRIGRVSNSKKKSNPKLIEDEELLCCIDFPLCEHGEIK